MALPPRAIVEKPLNSQPDTARSMVGAANSSWSPSAGMMAGGETREGNQDARLHDVNKGAWPRRVRATGGIFESLLDATRTSAVHARNRFKRKVVCIPAYLHPGSRPRGQTPAPC